MIDIESDGTIPGDYSMISFGAIAVHPSLIRTFAAWLRPISESWIPEALAVSGFSRDQIQTFDAPKIVMDSFANWLRSLGGGRPMFVSDNNGFDWMFV